MFTFESLQLDLMRYVYFVSIACIGLCTLWQIYFRLILTYEGQHIVLHSTGEDYDEFKTSFNG